MDTERWEQIQEIYLRAADLEPPAREGFLQTACGDDADLLGEVRSLLDADATAETFLDVSLDTLALLLAGDGDEEEDIPAPRRVGPYRIVGLLGRGGMGLVYRAERDDDQYSRTVALKLIRGGATDPDAQARFRRERQILAGLEHPGIARLYETGVSDDAVPWLAMELVDGEPIHRWCDAHGLGIEERVHLFERVCEAVEYAHRSLVIHRDLKPSNIFVTGDGRVKLLDFGIARLLDSDDGVDDPLTRVGQRVLTPAYSSPEQLRGERLTTASDVYTLGVVLHRLLTGTTPDLPTEGHTVARPSAAIGAGDGATPWMASDRLRRRLQGDLDTLLMKALRSEPGERYASVAEMREDMARWRERRPLRARPPSLGYRLSRFLRRNRGAVAATSAVTILLTFAAVALVRAERRAQAEAARAEVEAQTATRVSDFLVELMASSAPEVAQGEDVTVRQVLDEAASRLEGQLEETPEVKSRLYHQLGTTYYQLGLLEQADELFRRGLALHDADPYLNWERRFDLLNGRYNVLEQLARYDEAEAALLEASELHERHAGTPQQRSMVALNLGLLYSTIGRLDESEGLLRETIAIDSLLMVADTSTDLSYSLNNLALVLYAKGDTEDALDLFGQVLAMRRLTLGDRHPMVAQSLTNLGTVMQNVGDFEGGEPYLREAMELNRELYGEEHHIVANDLQALAFNLRGQGRAAEAKPLAEESLEMRLRTVGRDNPGVGLSLATLAQISMDLGDSATALRYYEDAHATFLRTFGEDHQYTATTAVRAGRTRMLVQGDTASAVRDMERGLRWFVEVQGADHPTSREIRNELAEILRSWGRDADADRILATYAVSDAGR